MERLNDSLTHKLALISTLTGFGKTALLGDWVRKINMPVAWGKLLPGCIPLPSRSVDVGIGFGVDRGAVAGCLLLLQPTNSIEALLIK
jgi:hypothetical protein